ncbi:MULTISPECIES: agmatinase [Burkholderia]|uniref:Agmatinase n=1 Tax=Burkholderia contaminans TaxID=488447 RepID=A0A2S5DQL3_9BURK|nr:MULTISPECIES: agmatinase [Burkholderia]EKS9797922.1 agmatinase [Burkholderia cepacia]EKS9804984.1 agmatinase [Burkholderia cepacia]EKS9812645.1 agmatinase [Burkholderia cepacia]EKS9820679.1 agmatinase [Burkholderia cepacia]EKS9830684.1 agmatinase [Burkholderia cepacia]
MQKQSVLRGDGAIRRESPYGSSKENTYAGVVSFMRRLYTKELAGVDLAVTGVPLDIATTNRPGARLGPRAIRAASSQLGVLLPYPWGINPFDDYAVIDYGDCWLDVHNPSTVRETIVTHARTILDAGARMLTLGGDHYISYPLLVAHAEKYGRPLSLIHFDAHCDTWPDDRPDSLNHGSMFYKAIKDGLIDPAHSVQVGIRTWNDDFMGVSVLDAAWVHEHGVNATIARIVEIVGARPTYFTFDVDGLDPAFAPGTGTPVPGGLSSAQALSIIRGLTSVDLVGADVVEVAPAYDHADMTALVAAHVASELICLFRHRARAARHR